MDRASHRRFGRGVDERATVIAALMADLHQSVEHADQPCAGFGTGRPGRGFQPPPPQLVDPAQVGNGEVVLAREMPVERGLGDPGLRR